MIIKTTLAAGVVAAVAALPAALLAPTVPTPTPAPQVELVATVGTLAGFTQPETEMAGMIGSLCDPPNVCQIIHYNNFFPDPNGGVAPTSVFVNTTTGEQIVVGYSLGGAVITLYTRQNPSLPGEDISFITFGNPFIGQIPGTVDYPVTEVLHEYDHAVDPPDNWFNLLAVANFLMSDRHCCYSDADLTTTDARVYVDGNVTYRLIDTYPLPLIAWLDPSITVWLDPILRPVVDAGYDRDFQRYPEVSSTTAVTQEVTSWTEPTSLVAVSPTINESPPPSTSNSSSTASDSHGRTSKKAPKLTSSSTATTSDSPNAPSHPTTRKSVKSGKSPTTGAPTKSSASNATAKKSEPKPKHEAKAPKRGGGHGE